MQNNVIKLPFAADYGDENPDIDGLSSLVAELGIDGLTEDELAQYIAGKVNDDLREIGHYDNLAEFMDDKSLQKIATEVINWVDWDEESREDWEIRESKGIKLLGVSDKTEGGAAFEGASRVVHPLLAEAIAQFHSRAITELWPPEGPVKTQVLGEITPQKVEQAERVQDYLNYLYTTEMPGAFDEEDKMLFRLPLSGSCFKKVYYDPLERVICSRLVEPADFIVPYSAVDLRTAPRFTHRLREMHNDVLKKQRAGHYRQTELGTPLNEQYDYPRVKEEIDHTEGRNRTQIDDDQRHTILEMYVDYDLEGFEDMDEAGKETGIALPYIITVDRDEQTVLRIQRNWRPDDELKRKRVYFTHYKFSPGLGFYGYGLLHLIGGLSSSATGALRSLLDAAQFANMQGGYKSRDSKIEGGDVPIAPGEWREVNSSAEELSKGFFSLPYKEPSKTLFELLGYLDERGQRFAGTTENMVGEANNSAPVGTTLALIEQGSKAFTAIHKRLHEAHSKEFKILHDLCYDYLPADGYPYQTAGMDSIVMMQDFDGRVDVVPVSDPNIISSTQRIAQAQAILDLADKYPEKVNLDKAIENMLKVMRVPDADEYMINEPDPIEQQAQQLELEDKAADIDKKKAETVVKNVEGLYSAMQSAQTVATIPGVAPIADEIYLSAGGEDKNGFPIANPPTQAEQLPTRYSEQTRINIDQNTSPMFPPNPQSPVEGVTEGIETPENDGY